MKAELEDLQADGVTSPLSLAPSETGERQSPSADVHEEPTGNGVTDQGASEHVRDRIDVHKRTFEAELTNSLNLGVNKPSVAVKDNQGEPNSNSNNNNYFDVS